MIMVFIRSGNSISKVVVPYGHLMCLSFRLCLVWTRYIIPLVEGFSIKCVGTACTFPTSVVRSCHKPVVKAGQSGLVEPTALSLTFLALLKQHLGLEEDR